MSGGLQLVVPSYGLRLVRRFGAESVGWFLVVAFSSLGLLHLFGTGRPASVAGVALATEAIYAVGALLLLVGMGHLEALCSERLAGSSKERDLCGKWTSRIQSETSELIRKNQELLEQQALCEQRLLALEDSATRYHSLFDNNPQAMWVFDLRTRRILAANKAAARLYGLAREDLLACSAGDLMAESATERFSQYVATRCTGSETPICLVQKPKGRAPMETEMLGLDLRYDGAPARLVLVTDLAQRHQHDAELRNSVRFEVVSRVAGGFAHHFNNLLAIIEGRAALLQDEKTDAKSAQHLQHISTAVSRAATLTRQLLTVAGQRESHVAPMELNGLLMGMNQLIRRLVGNGVVLQTGYDSALPLVVADAYLVEQVLVNLVLNARDAMPNGGTISIQTSTIRRETAPVGNEPTPSTGEFVRLTVRDTGCGMTPEVQARLFEPFFTTKEVGQGTGLGLASVYGALKQQSGWIEFSSEPGKGTEARVFLPCAPVSEKIVRTKSYEVSRGTVLLVEADDRTRSMARCVLNWNGYRVIEADGSATALMLWETQLSNIDLLLVDASLDDGLSGQELARRLSRAKPSLKVVFGSAPVAAGSGEGLEPNERVTMVARPYTPELLLQAVRSCLPAKSAKG